MEDNNNQQQRSAIKKYLIDADTAEKNNDFPKAVEIYNTLLTEYDKYPILYMYRSLFYMQRSLCKYKEAIDDLDRAFSLMDSPEGLAFTTSKEQECDRANMFYLRSTCNLDLSQLKSALADITRACELKPEHVNYSTHLGRVLLTMRKGRKALPIVEKLLQNNQLDDSQKKELLKMKHEALFQTQNYQEALNTMQDFIKPEVTSDKLTVDENMRKAQSFMALRKFQEALQFLEPDMLDKLDDHGRQHAYFFRGVCSFYLQQPQSAIENFNVALSIIKKTGMTDIRADIYQIRAECYAQIGNTDQEVKDFKKAIACRSTYFLPYLNLARAYNKQAKGEESLQYAEKAVQLNPNENECYNQRGLAYLHTRKFPEAVADFTKCLELNPGYASAEKNLSTAVRGLIDPSSVSTKPNTENLHQYKEVGQGKFICTYCHKFHSERIRRCTGCYNAQYCDTTCQKAHWKQHKLVCKPK
jgi:tetratricopeptide (TPR) repeat protein